MEKFSFKNSYQDTLQGNKWEIKNPKAIIILVTGMAEHSERYDNFASFLNQNQYSIYCLDHYGQGLNGKLGRPGKDYFFKMVETLKELILEKKKEYPNLPIYMFAHSMGTFVTQNFIEHHSNLIDKVVLCGSGYKNKFLSKLAKLVAQIVTTKKNYDKDAKLLCNLSVGGFDKKIKATIPNEWISYNKDNVILYNNNPYDGFNCSNGFYLEFFKGLASIHNKKLLKAVNKNLDVFIIGGIDDPVSSCGKELPILHKLYLNCGIKATLKHYDKMRHEILNEKEHQLVYDDVLEFYNK